MSVDRQTLLENQDKIEEIKGQIVRENLNHVKNGSLMKTCSLNESVAYLSSLCVSLGKSHENYLNELPEEEIDNHMAIIESIDRKIEEIVNTSLFSGITSLDLIITMMLSCTGNIYTAIKAIEKFDKEYEENK